MTVVGPQLGRTWRAERAASAEGARSEPQAAEIE
jgi:hypothetical protein